MKVKLVSLTTCEGMTPEELIVYIARVSNPENQNNKETSTKLIQYLIKHKHWSPFDMVDMTVEVVTSRAIAQQMIRHKSFFVQEFSMRYSKATCVEPTELRGKASTNRQSSSELIDNPVLKSKVLDHIDESLKLYDLLIEEGVAKECARGILPLNTQTTLYFKGSIRSWIHYLEIRCAENTQLEHRQVALECQKIFKENFPNIYQAVFG